MTRAVANHLPAIVRRRGRRERALLFDEKSRSVVRKVGQEEFIQMELGHMEPFLGCIDGASRPLDVAHLIYVGTKAALVVALVSVVTLAPPSARADASAARPA